MLDLSPIDLSKHWKQNKVLGLHPVRQTFRVHVTSLSRSFACAVSLSRQSVVWFWGQVDLGPAVLLQSSSLKQVLEQSFLGAEFGLGCENTARHCHVVKKAPKERSLGSTLQWPMAESILGR